MIKSSSNPNKVKGQVVIALQWQMTIADCGGGHLFVEIEQKVPEVSD